MNVRTLASVVERILEVQRAGAMAALQQIVAALRAVDGGAKADKEREINDALRRLRTATKRFVPDSLDPHELNILKILDPTGKTTPNGVREVASIISRFAGSPGKSADAVEQFRVEFQNVVTVCTRLQNGLKPFVENQEAEPQRPEGYKEVTVWMKGQTAPLTLKELERQISDWLLLLRGYARLTDTDPAIPLIRVDDGSVGAVLGVVATVWAALMATVQVVQTLAKDRRERGLNIKNALRSSMDEELRARIDEVIDQNLQAILDQHVNDLISKYQGDQDTDHEVRTAIQVSTQKLYSFYLEGGYVSFSLDSAEGEEEAKAIGSLEMERRQLQGSALSTNKMLESGPSEEGDKPSSRPEET